MDILSQVKQATEFQINKLALSERIKTQLHLAYNQGLFFITPELIGFLNAWDSTELVLMDSYGNPVKINRPEFLAQAKQHYQTVLNDYYIEYERLRTIRKV
jgi:hypothetical protein